MAYLWSEAPKSPDFVKIPCFFPVKQGIGAETGSLETACTTTLLCVSGIVRLTGHELADQNRSPPSRGELTPFSERGSAVSLENIAAVEVAVLVEVVVDRGMGGGELLQGLDVPEFRHRTLSSSKRLV